MVKSYRSAAPPCRADAAQAAASGPQRFAAAGRAPVRLLAAGLRVSERPLRGRVVNESRAPHDHDELLLRPPQFTLRTLLIGMSLVALLCSLVQWVTPAGLIAIVLLIAVIVCHVAGNAIGTRLRQLGMERARQQLPQERLPLRPAVSGELPLAAATPLPTTTQPAPAPSYLGQRRSLGWPVVLASGAGFVLGGAGGVLGALEKSGGVWLPEVVAVGAVAFAVLGGLAAFAMTALVHVGLGAVRQALCSTSADADPPAQR
jgi:hypothetical protein